MTTSRLARLALALCAAAFVSAVATSVSSAASPIKAPPRAGANHRHSLTHRPIGARLPVRNDLGEVEADEEDGASTASGSSQDFMRYRGGWVQESPQLYIVYWGDWSLTNDTYNVQNRLWYFLQGVGGSSWARTLTGYGYNCTVGGMD